MKLPTYVNRSEDANGDGVFESTVTTRMSRLRMPRSTSMSAGMSNTSCRHSRYASRMIGNEPKRDATCMSCDARRRVCQSGDRLPGEASRQQQRATRGFAEARREERSLGEPRDDEILRAIGIRQRDLGRRRRGRLGEARDDAVVGPEDVDLEIGALAHHRADRHRPRRVHLAAERREHAHAPVPHLVEIALDDDRPIVGDGTDGRVLVGEVLEQVARGALVEVVLLDQPSRSFRLIRRAQRARERADRATEFERTRGRSRPSRTASFRERPARARRARGRG